MSSICSLVTIDICGINGKHDTGYFLVKHSHPYNKIYDIIYDMIYMIYYDMIYDMVYNI